MGKYGQYGCLLTSGAALYSNVSFLVNQVNENIEVCNIHTYFLFLATPVDAPNFYTLGPLNKRKMEALCPPDTRSVCTLVVNKAGDNKEEESRQPNEDAGEA